ncbi:Putative ribonuclease H protein At1g65750, partial [Linum perenne]
MSRGYWVVIIMANQFILNTRLHHLRCKVLHSFKNAKVILTMRPPSGEGCNSSIWRYEKKGNYSVRSAYRVASEEVGAINVYYRDGPWNLLWQQSLPPKSKIMFWKMAHNILATRQALRRRGIDLDVRCGICAGATETMEHIFFECSIAVDCWNRSGIRRWIESLPGFGTDCRQWVFEIVKSGATYLIQQA